MLEYLYLVSAFCIPVPSEIGQGFQQLQFSFASINKGWFLLAKNFSRFIGSILAEVVSMDACVESWSGLCFGQKIGKIGGYLLDTSAESVIIV